MDAELLVSHVTGYTRAQLYAFPERELDNNHGHTLDALLQERLTGKPLAYLTGTREFWSLPLSVSPSVLIPRPDTETLVERVLTLESKAPSGCIIELGTGSGAIALALAQELKNRAIVAVELQAGALSVAYANVKRFGHDRVQLMQGNWLDAFDADCAAMIVANPPYLAADDPHLPQLAYEPRSALVSGNNGLHDIEHIIASTQRVGKPGCVLIIEHGFEQASAVQALMTNYTYTNVRTERDLGNNERITHATISTGAQ